MKTTIRTLALVVLPVLFGALALGGVQDKAIEQKPGSMPMMMQNSPFMSQGTEVSIEDTAGGIALTFTNKADKVADLQRRAERMATMHNADRPHEGMMMQQMIAFTAKYEAIENGSRLTLTPKDPAKLSEFRSEVRAHVDRMKNGECPMMQNMMHGMHHS